jgi:hypothetical protein
VRALHAAQTFEERSERSRRHWAAKTPEQRGQIARDREAAKTPEQRSERMRKANASRTPEEKRDIGRRTYAMKSQASRQRFHDVGSYAGCRARLRKAIARKRARIDALLEELAA